MAFFILAVMVARILLLIFVFTQNIKGQEEFIRDLKSIEIFDKKYAEPSSFEQKLTQIKKKYNDKITSCPYNYLLNKKSAAYYFSVITNDSLALEIQQKVLAQQRHCPTVERSAFAITFFNIAQAYLYLGQADKSQEYFDKVIATELSLKRPHDATSHHYTWIGEYYYINGDIEKALNYYDKAQKSYLGGRNDYRYRDLMQKTGQAFIRAKQYYLATENLKKALAITRSLKNEVPTTETDVLMFLWEANFHQKKYEAAEGYIIQAMGIAKFHNLIKTEIIMKSFLQDTKIAKGEYDKAEQILKEIKKLIASTENPSFKLTSGNKEEFGDLYYEKGNYQKAISFYQEGLKIITKDLDSDININPRIGTRIFPDEHYLKRQLGLKARAMKALGEKEKNLANLESSIDAILKYDTLNRRLLIQDWNEQSHLTLLSESRDYYQVGIEAAINAYEISDDNKYIERAYNIVSRLKSQMLSRGINLEKKKQELLSDSIILLEKAKKDTIRVLGEKYLASMNSSEEEQNAAYKSFSDERLRLDLFNKKNGLNKLLDQSDFIQIPEVRQLQKVMSDNSAHLEFHIHDSLLYSFIITKTDIQYFQSKIANAEVLKQYEQFTAGKESKTVFLDKKLLRYLTNLPQDKLTIIPDQGLLQIPFEALYLTDDKKWIDKFEISYEYGATFIDQTIESNANLSYTGFASDYTLDRFSAYNKKLAKNLEPLKFTIPEVTEAKQILNGVLYLNEEATIPTLKSLTPPYGILHFALHGKLDSKYPDRSALIFESENGNYELSASELYNLSIPTELTILSACNSGAGNIEVGDGVRSLTRSFIHAGSKSVITSLWEAADASTSLILNSFFAYIKSGKRKSEALRLAKLDYLSSASPTYQHPKYWAHLVLVGNSDKMVSSFSFPKMITGLVLFTLFLFFLVQFLKRRE